MKISSISSWLLAGLLAVSFAFQTPVTPGAGVMAQENVEAATPFQQALMASLSERQAAGLPVPQVELGQPVQQGLLMAAEGGQAITATTVIRYDSPQQAGYDSWPAFTLPTGEGGAEEDYSQTLSDAMAAVVPGFWDHYQVGQEPRTYIVEETISAPVVIEQQSALSEMVGLGEILFGFTEVGNYTYDISTDVLVCWDDVCGTAATASASFWLYWAAGLRLPMRVNIYAPDTVEIGQTFTPSASLTGLDWSPEDYLSASVFPFDGNEFVLLYNYSLDGTVYIPAFNVTLSAGKDGTFDRSSSFKTPLGAGSSVALPDIDLPPDLTGLYAPIIVGDLGIGLVIHTQMLVDAVYAHWQSYSQDWAPVTGGDIAFTTPDTQVRLGMIDTCLPDMGTYLRLQLDSFTYKFSGFAFDLGAYMKFWLGPYHVESDEYPIFHITVPTPDEIRLGIHPFTVTTVNANIDLQDFQPPTSEIQLSGVMGNNGWYRSDVGVNILSSDGACGSGVERVVYQFYDWDWLPYSGPFTLTTDGRTDIHFFAYDRFWNAETPQHFAQVYIDKTPPTLSGVPVPAANAYGWNNTKVLIWFSCSDFQSGIAYMTPDTLLGKQGVGQTVTGVCIDNAGNRTPLTVSNVNIDKTPPSVTIVSPQTTIIAHDQAITLAWQAGDDLSGLLDQTATLDGSAVTNGQSIDLLTLSLGTHTLTVQAGDRAGNNTFKYRAFKIISTFDSLRAIVARLRGEGHIRSQDTADRIVAQLNLAEAALNRGDTAGAITILNGLMDRINGQLGNQIDETAYWILRGDIKGLLKNQG